MPAVSKARVQQASLGMGTVLHSAGGMREGSSPSSRNCTTSGAYSQSPAHHQGQAPPKCSTSHNAHGRARGPIPQYHSIKSSTTGLRNMQFPANSHQDQIAEAWHEFAIRTLSNALVLLTSLMMGGVLLSGLMSKTTRPYTIYYLRY